MHNYLPQIHTYVGHTKLCKIHTLMQFTDHLER